MKAKRLWLILPLLVALFGAQCKKEKEDKTVNLNGRWELKSEANGLNGKLSEYPTNNGNLIIFSGNNYTIFSDHQEIKSGSFAVEEEVSILTNLLGHRLIYDHDTEQIRTFFSINGDQLKIYVDAFDGPSSVYIKIR